MGNAYWLAETTVSLIEDTIRANIAQTLADVRQERNDPIVTTYPPQEYFQYEKAHGYRAPAVFTIIKNFDMRDQTMGANHINAMCEVIVAVVVEDRIEARIVKKAWRYQAALAQILHQSSLTNSDGSVRLFTRVQNCQFSGVINIKDEKASDAVFRKEVSLRLQVEHIENLQPL
jgi:hypothetical protein